MGPPPPGSSDLSKQQSGAMSHEEGIGGEEYGLTEEQAPAPYMPTLPEGMETSASTPQVNDPTCISETLVGLVGRKSKDKGWGLF